MGVDFRLGLGKKIKNKVIPYCSKDAPHFYTRYTYLFDLFRKNRKKIIELADSKISFKFYDNPSKDKFTNPDVFWTNLNKIFNILKLNPEKFPFFYSFVNKKYAKKRENDYHKGSQHLDQVVFINGKKASLICGWNECYLYWLSEQNKKVDLTKKKEIECNEHVVVKPAALDEEPEKAIVKIGEKATYLIIKESLYEYYKPEIDKMIKVCKFAKDKRYLIKGDVS